MLRPASKTAVSAFYGCSEANIQDNYLRNESRFVSGVHFHKLIGDDLRRFKNDQPANSGVVAPRASHLFLWTEKGAARHAKMLSTDRAWDVFEQLEDSYFAMTEISTAIGYEGNIPALIEDISDALLKRQFRH